MDAPLRTPAFVQETRALPTEPHDLEIYPGMPAEATLGSVAAGPGDPHDHSDRSASPSGSSDGGRSSRRKKASKIKRMEERLRKEMMAEYGRYGPYGQAPQAPVAPGPAGWALQPPPNGPLAQGGARTPCDAGGRSAGRTATASTTEG